MIADWQLWPFRLADAQEATFVDDECRAWGERVAAAYAALATPEETP